jgi:glutaredoxin
MKETIVWSKPNCPYCVKAKDLLNASGINYQERVITQGWTKEQLLEVVPDAKTVPQIFIHGQYVGGYDSLIKYYEDHNMNIGGIEI